MIKYDNKNDVCLDWSSDILKSFKDQCYRYRTIILCDEQLFFCDSVHKAGRDEEQKLSYAEKGKIQRVRVLFPTQRNFLFSYLAI